MRENRTYGSEGGEDLVLPDPYQAVPTNTSAVLNSVVGAASAANKSPTVPIGLVGATSR